MDPQQPQQQPQRQEMGADQLSDEDRMWDTAEESRMDKGLATMDRILQRRREAQQPQPQQPQPQQPQQPPAP